MILHVSSFLYIYFFLMSEAETAEMQTPDELMPQVEELKYLWGSWTCHE